MHLLISSQSVFSPRWEETCLHLTSLCASEQALRDEGTCVLCSSGDRGQPGAVSSNTDLSFSVEPSQRVKEPHVRMDPLRHLPDSALSGRSAMLLQRQPSEPLIPFSMKTQISPHHKRIVPVARCSPSSRALEQGDALRCGFCHAGPWKPALGAPRRGTSSTHTDPVASSRAAALGMPASAPHLCSAAASSMENLTFFHVFAGSERSSWPSR